MEGIDLKKFVNLTVSEVMTSDPMYATPDDKISATELIMLRKKIGGFPVVNEQKHKKIIGIITQRDIRLARFAISLESPKTVVKDLMTPNPFVVKKNDTLFHALELMFKNDIERLPVVNDNKELIGLISGKDILRKIFELSKS